MALILPIITGNYYENQCDPCNLCSISLKIYFFLFATAFANCFCVSNAIGVAINIEE